MVLYSLFRISSHLIHRISDNVDKETRFLKRHLMVVVVVTAAAVAAAGRLQYPA